MLDFSNVSMSPDVKNPTLWLRILRAMHAVRLLFIGHLRIFRLRKPNVLVACLVIVER